MRVNYRSRGFKRRLVIRGKTKRLQSPEGEVQLSIIRYCKMQGYTIGKTKTMGVMRGKRFCYDPYVFRGFPDLTAFTPELVFIEVKSKTGRQSADQKAFQELCEGAGIPYILARSVEDVEARGL